MKKNIKWLKAKLEFFEQGEYMFTEDFNAGVQQTLEYVQELIDQLEYPEDTLDNKIIEEYKQLMQENTNLKIRLLFKEGC